MAYFAKIDENGIVIEVQSVANPTIEDSEGVEQESLGVDFLNNVHKTNDVWKQTSYNNSFRKQYAGPGYTYDAVKDKFISPQPHASWTLDANDDWQAPIAYPSIISEDIDQSGETVTVHFPYIKWDEANQKWIGQKANSSTGSGLVDIEWDPGAGVWNTL